MPTLRPSFHSLRARKYHWSWKTPENDFPVPMKRFQEVKICENSIIFRWTMLKLRCFLWVFCCWSWDGRFGKEFFLRWRVCTNWFDELQLEVSYLKFLFTSEIGRDFWLHRFPYGLWRFFPPAFDATKQKKPPRQKDWSCCSTGECISRKRMCLGTLDCSRSSREWMYTYIWLYVYIYI